MNFILIENDRIISMFDDRYTAIPIDAIAISDSEWKVLRDGFADYKYIAGELIYSQQDSNRIAAIKQAARAHILARYPDWKQANMTARMLELVNKKLTTPLTAPEAYEEAALIAAWDWVKAVRGASNVAEQTAGMTAEQIVWPV